MTLKETSVSVWIMFTTIQPLKNGSSPMLVPLRKNLGLLLTREIKLYQRKFGQKDHFSNFFIFKVRQLYDVMLIQGRKWNLLEFTKS